MTDNQIQSIVESAKRELYDAYRYDLNKLEQRFTKTIAGLERKLNDIDKQYKDHIDLLHQHIDQMRDRLDAYDSQNSLNDIVKSIAIQHKQSIVKQKFSQNNDERNNEDQKAIDTVWNALKNNEPI